jgi:nitroreductase
MLTTTTRSTRTRTRTAILIQVLPLLLSLLASSTETHAFTPSCRNPVRRSFYLNLQEASTSTQSTQSTPSNEVTSSSTKSEESEVTSSDDDDDDFDFDKILQTRRTINDFQPNLPEKWELTLQHAVQSAMYAPNHKRTEPWRFHLLGPNTIRQVCELNASIVTEKKGEKAGEKKLNRWLQMPGWLVVTCRKDIDDDSGTSVSMEDPSGIEREDYAACCCAVQNLCLSLHNAGMGTKWTTGPVNFDPRFNDIVGLDNDGEYVVGTIWFGIPDKVPDAPKKRKSLDEVFIKHE